MSCFGPYSYFIIFIGIIEEKFSRIFEVFLMHGIGNFNPPSIPPYKSGQAIKACLRGAYGKREEDLVCDSG